MKIVKDCTKCHKTKNLTEFYKQGKYYSGMCKPCFRAYTAERQRILGEPGRVIKLDKDSK